MLCVNGQPLAHNNNNNDNNNNNNKNNNNRVSKRPFSNQLKTCTFLT